MMSPLPLRVASRSVTVVPRGASTRLGRTAYALLWLGAVSASAALGVTGRSLAVALAIGALTAVALAGLVALGGLLVRLRGARPGTIEVGSETITVEGGGRRHVVPRHRVRSGCVVPSLHTATVRAMTVSGDEIVAEVASVAEADALVAALGVAPSQRVFRLPWGETLFVDLVTALVGSAVVAALVAIPAVALPATAMLAPCAWLALMTLLFVLVRGWLGPARVLVGRDGIRYRRLFVEQFLPWSRLARAEWDGFHLLLDETHGRRHRVRTRWMTHAQGEAFVTRLRDARLSWGEGEASPELFAELNRRGRSIDAWSQALRAALAGPSYRRAGVDTEELDRTLADPSAPVERRIGAALGLATSGDAWAREKIRLTADASAAGHFRAALEATLRDELDVATVRRAVQEGGGREGP